MDAQKNQQTDEILNAILPPRYMVVLSACTGTLSMADKGEGGDQGPNDAFYATEQTILYYTWVVGEIRIMLSTR